MKLLYIHLEVFCTNNHRRSKISLNRILENIKTSIRSCIKKRFGIKPTKIANKNKNQPWTTSFNQSSIGWLSLIQHRLWFLSSANIFEFTLFAIFLVLNKLKRIFHKNILQLKTNSTSNTYEFYCPINHFFVRLERMFTYDENINIKRNGTIVFLETLKAQTCANISPSIFNLPKWVELAQKKLKLLMIN